MEELKVQCLAREELDELVEELSALKPDAIILHPFRRKSLRSRLICNMVEAVIARNERY